MRQLRIALVLAVVVGALGAVTAFTSPPSSTTAAHDELVAAASRDCAATCTYTCFISIEHKNLTGGPGGYGLGRHGCFDQLDCDYHSCSVGAAPPKSELDRVMEEDGLEALLHLVPRRNVEYVAERGVVQLLADCGSVIAQLPVTPAAMAVLSTE